MNGITPRSCSGWREALASLGAGAVALLALMVWLLACGARAEVSPFGASSQVGEGGLWLLPKSGEASRAAPVLSLDVEIRITGPLARTQVRQRFHNPGPDFVEGRYLFPLPTGAAVDHLRLRMGEQVIEGEIQEKEKAQRTYERARARGQRTSLLQQERPNLFTASVANIPPGEDVTVEIEYQQTLPWDQGIFQLRFPLVMGPRFFPPGKPAVEESVSLSRGFATAQDRERLTAPLQPPEQPPVNPVTLRVFLAAGFPLQSIHSVNHPVDIEEQGDGRHYITLRGAAHADRDFVLEWRAVADHEPKAAFFSEKAAGAVHGLLMVTPPDPQGFAPTPRARREVIFVIDTSGSMGGSSIRQAKKSLAWAVSRLKGGDRFNIIRYSDQTHSLFPHPVAVTAETLAEAEVYVAGLEAGGGTMVAPALRLALVGAGSPSFHLRQVIFLTDGAVGNEAALFSIIENNLGDSRLFTIGIGSAPNGHFMREAARFGRGSHTFISRADEVAERMEALFRKIEQPALTDIQVSFGGEVEQAPRRIGDLYLGEPVVVLFRMAHLPKEAVVSGRYGNQPWRMTIPLQKNGADQAGVAVAWAREKMDDLLGSRGMTPEEIRSQVVAVALAHHLTSPYTSLVAVDKTPVRPHGEGLRPHKMPLNLPHGWEAKHFGLAQTATPAPLLMVLGSILCAFGALLRRKNT